MSISDVGHMLTQTVVLGLNFGGESSDWTSPKSLVLICVGLAASAMFFLVEAKFAKFPLMPLKLFKNRSNAATIALGGLHYFVSHALRLLNWAEIETAQAMIGPEFYLPLYFQSAKLARPLQSGLLGLPFVFLEGLGGISSGAIIHRTGRYNALLYVGAVVSTLGFGLLIDFKSSTGLVKILIYQSIGALGSGLLMQPPLVAIQANVSQENTATATATLTFVQGLAQAISIVVGGVVFQSSMALRQVVLLDAGVSNELLNTFSGADAQANVAKLHSIQDTAQQHQIQAAYAWSLRNLWILYAATAALTIALAYFVGTHTLATEHVETRTGIQDREHQQ